MTLRHVFEEVTEFLRGLQLLKQIRNNAFIMPSCQSVERLGAGDLVFVGSA